MKLKQLYEGIYNKVFSVGLFKKLLRIPGVEKLLSWEVVSYILFGLLTTAVNLLAYFLINLVPGKGYQEKVLFTVGNFDFLWLYFAQAFAWVVAVLFAYFTNKLFVFESRSFAAKTVLREMASFFSARFVSFLLFEELLFAVCVKYLHMGDWWAKILLAVFNVVCNYAVSKLFIFRKKKTAEDHPDRAPDAGREEEAQ